jgi:polysaccharide biosynthesis protein PslH
MSSLRILIVLTDPPLPFGKAAARWFYVLCKGLVGRGHRVTIFVAYDDFEDAERARKLFPSPEYDLRCYPQQRRSGLTSKMATLRRPYSYLFNSRLQADLEGEIARGYDILHLEHVWTGWLGLRNVRRALLNVHYAFGIDLTEENYSSLDRNIWRLLSLRAEKSLLRKYPHITTLTSRLSDFVKLVNPSASVQTTPLGLDLSLYPFESVPEPLARPIVSLIGSFSWGPTYSAGVRLLTRLWPEIKHRIPNAQLQLIGREARRAMAPYSNGPDIVIHEDVPNTVPYFRQAGVMLYAPSRGSGMKVKVLEAMALGTPVVTTAEGVEGLPAVDGVHACISEDDKSLIENVVALFEEPFRRQRLRLAARSMLEQYCSPSRTIACTEDSYRLILAGNR